jgi:hypothetical protein
MLLKETQQVKVFGVDKGGNYYPLKSRNIIRDGYRVRGGYRVQTLIYVELPFEPNHDIWKELRNE